MADIKELTFEKLVQYHVQEELSLQDIANIYQTSRQRVYQIKSKLEKEHGSIKRPKTGTFFKIKKMLDEGKKVPDIAKELNVKASKINRLIRTYEEKYRKGELPIKIQRKSSRNLLPKALLYHLYQKEGLTDKESGERYQVSSVTVWLLRKEYGIETIYKKKNRQRKTEGV